METKQHAGATVRSNHRLADYMPELAVTLARDLGAPASVMLADYLNLVAKRGDTFPADMSKGGRDQRLTRLLASPVQVDDVVIELRTRPKRHMYDKTRTITTWRGALEAAPPPAKESDVLRVNRDLAPSVLANMTPHPMESLRAELLAMEQRLFERLGAPPPKGAATSRAPAPLEAAPATATRPANPNGARDWPPESDGAWLSPASARYSRPRLTLQLEENEHNLAVLQSHFGVPAAPETALAEPEWSLRDCELRARRFVAGCLALRDRAGLEPRAYEVEPPEPVTAWPQLGLLMSGGCGVLNRVREKHALWALYRPHPEMSPAGSEKEPK